MDGFYSPYLGNAQTMDCTYIPVICALGALSLAVSGGFDDFCDHEMITLMTSDGHAVCGSPVNVDPTPSVDCSEILHQLRLVDYSHYLQGFIHPNGGWEWDF